MIDIAALANEPELARDLPRDLLTRLMIACALALMGDPQPRATMDRAMGDALSTESAARLIGISANTLSHRAHAEPYCQFLLPTGTRRLAFSRRAIEEWQARDGNYIHGQTRDRQHYGWEKRGSK